MQILVINSGSSSIKFSMYADEGARPMEAKLRLLYDGELSGIGGGPAKFEFRDAAGKDLSAGVGEVKAASMEDAIRTFERAVGLPELPKADAVGYRVVHPGARLRGHQLVTPQVLEELKKAVAFAPLHEPAAVVMMEEMMRRLPGVPRYACFDTVFHETMPEEAWVYPLPEALCAEGVRRYGFHGLSCESVVTQLRAESERGVEFPRRLAIAHLGSGCSVTACIDGRSVDTTMGLTPTGGVVMGTRPGDLDPGLVLYLLRRPGATVDSVEAMLNRDAGLKALGGTNDMRGLRKSVAQGNAAAGLAVRVFCRSVVKAIAGFIALYGADALVFTGGIGEHDAASREEIGSGLSGFGVALDSAANQLEGRSQGVRKISGVSSRVAVYVVPAEEDLTIARHVAQMCRASQRTGAYAP
jgi:acetate kinase